ncbi:MAG: RtcB family protein [Armatimonadota bacterium]|nr:RtcB family protein [Armatimonadota bacterium]
MSRQAASLKKSGSTETEILAAIEAEYGRTEPMGTLRDTPAPFHVYGEIGDDINPVAVSQLKLALRLPIALGGALMPDAHVGYALPIGGVFAAHRAVSPAMVGVDIGCRMHLSLFALPPDEFRTRREKLFRDLQAVTIFGIGKNNPRPTDHPLLDDSDRWALTSQTRGLRDKARRQIGTSGSGNHFAELVVGERLNADTGLPESFGGLLTHSGSRGVGYAIANHYARLAALETTQTARVPKMYEWLSLNGDAGREYWAAMELAGDFAQANHEIIHAAFAQRTGLTPFQTIQNHHNFAWLDGSDRVIHRKGATPAEKGVLGVIPGSMGSASYLVRGEGKAEALHSASHGAGRVGSRTAVRDEISLGDVRRFLKQQDILVEGLTAAEAPPAYKDIERILRIQVDAGLVTTLAQMFPIAVIMAGE